MNSKPIPAKLVTDVVQRWRAGARLPALAREATEELKRTIYPATIHAWIVKHLGGQEGFNAAAAVRDTEHPRKLFGGIRPTAVVIDDSAVEVITTGKGWHSESIAVHGYREDVFIREDGTRYVRARGNEKADFLFKPRLGGLAVMRLRLEHGSHVDRSVRRAKHQEKQDEVQHHQRRQVRAERRKRVVRRKR